MNLIPFNFSGRAVRVVEIDGEPWFLARDVAEILGYTNPSRSINDHCKSVKLLKTTDSVVLNLPSRGAQIIPERDVYRLIMRSRLPQAEAFEEWVVGEVLPSIRKTGQYNAEAFNPDDLSRADILRLALDSEEKRLVLEKKVKEDEPKVSFYEQFANADGLYGLQNAARALGQRPNKFVQELKRKYLFYQGSSLVAKVAYIQRGLFEVKSTVVDDAARLRVFVTPRGLQYFAKQLGVSLEDHAA